MKSIALPLLLGLLPLPAWASCQTAPFESFFHDFARDIRLQEAVTAETITLSQLDTTAESEPQLVPQEVSRAALEWPLVPNLTPFQRSGGTLRYETIPEGQSVTLTGDSGYLMTLIFTASPCWRLVAIRDESF